MMLALILELLLTNDDNNAASDGNGVGLLKLLLVSDGCCKRVRLTEGSF